MGTFKIEVQEFLSRVIEIDAKDVQDAFAEVQKQYKNEKIVLDYNDMLRIGQKIGIKLTIKQIENSKHDIFLSREESRKEAIKILSEWLEVT